MANWSCGRELVAVDGTRMAVNSRERNFTKAKLEKALAESDERLSRYLDRLDEADGQDESGTGAAKWRTSGRRSLRSKGGVSGLRNIATRWLRVAPALFDGRTRVGVGYNIQIAVDAKHKLIAEQQVHSKVSDLGLLAETAVAARRNLDRIDAVADAGYFKIEDIEACENAGVMPQSPSADQR